MSWLTHAVLLALLKESIETILEMAELKRRCRGLIVSGCLVQRYADELSTNCLGRCVPCTNELDKIDDVISDIEQPPHQIGRQRFYDYDQPVRRLLTTGHLAYLKIAEGCNRRCAFV